MKRLLSIFLVVIMMSLIMIIPVSATEEDFTNDPVVECTDHSTVTVRKKATADKNGNVNQVCELCGQVTKSSKIYKISQAFLSQDEFVFNNKVRAPKLYVLDKCGLILIKDKDYTVSYPTDRKSCGTHKVLIKFKGDYKGKKTLYFNIYPASTYFTTAKTASKNSISLKWKKATSGATGYQIQRSTSSTFKSGTVSSVNVKGSNTLSKTLSNLNASATYYLRIRTYNINKGKTVYSQWSQSKKLSMYKHSYSVEKLINTEKLTPVKTNYKKLDDLVTKTFKSIHTTNMTTYQKVKACYDFLVNKMSYQLMYGKTSPSVNYVSGQDSLVVRNAYSALSTKKGVCDDYSAAFVVMCRRLGLDAYMAGGTVSMAGGGRGGHAWTYIYLNGEKYVFDPQVQSNNKGYPYYYFGKTYAQMGSTYEYNPNGYNEIYYYGYKIYKEEKPPKNNLDCTVISTGSDKSITSTVEQEGSSSSTLGVYNTFTPPVKSYDNKFIEFDISIKGGSGIYEVLLIDQQNNKIIYDKVCKGSLKWEVDLSRFNKKTKAFTISVYDYKTVHNLHPSSVNIVDLQFKSKK